MRPLVVTHLTSADLRRNDPVLPRIARLLRPYRGPIALVIVAVVSAAALTSLAPFLVRAVFDDALFPLDGATHASACSAGWSPA
jgi:ATP-binding cassette subfamily B protein